MRDIVDEVRRIDESDEVLESSQNPELERFCKSIDDIKENDFETWGDKISGFFYSIKKRIYSLGYKS